MLAVVHDFADWRIVFRHHDQIHTHRFCSGLGLSVGYDSNLFALFIDEANDLRRNLIVSQRFFAVAFALDTASLPSRFRYWRQVSGLLNTIGHFLQHKQEREFTAGNGDSQGKRKPTNCASGRYQAVIASRLQSRSV
tara:strand:- start:61 stop:471 length:411 start_codon:yes stop_codon:yes gene_type:complete